MEWAVRRSRKEREGRSKDTWEGEVKYRRQMAHTSRLLKKIRKKGGKIM